jgi:hypothetical protein
LENLRGDSERQEQLPSWFVARCRLLVHLAAVSRSKRSAKLLQDTARARCVFGLLMDWAGFVEMTPAASTILGLGSRFSLDLALHVA